MPLLLIRNATSANTAWCAWLAGVVDFTFCWCLLSFPFLPKRWFSTRKKMIFRVLKSETRVLNTISNLVTSQKYAWIQGRARLNELVPSWLLCSAPIQSAFVRVRCPPAKWNLYSGGLKMGQRIMISRLEHFQSRPTVYGLTITSNHKKPPLRWF